MNKNNTSIPNSHQPSPSKSKNKDSEGRSEFTRYKLQREYQPKVRHFKHKLPKTTQKQRDVQIRIQRQKEQQSVAVNALQCFKKGEFINIDWKTKTNFRRSQISVKLPRLKTQNIEIKQLNLPNNKSIRSHTFQGRNAKSLKNKQIQQKRIKLKQLLYPKKTDRHSRIRDQNTQNQQIYQNRTSITSQNKSRQMLLKGFIVNSQLQGKSENLNTFLNQQKIIPQKVSNFNFASLRSQTQEMKHFKHLQDHLLQRSERDNKLRPNINNNIQSLNHHNQSSSLIQNSSTKNCQSISINQEQTLSKTLIVPQKKKEDAKIQQNYDILNDPDIYLLISKSRDQIIIWKESFVLDSMSHIERLKFLQQTEKTSPVLHQGRFKERAMSLQNALSEKKVEKQKMIQKIQDRKRINSQKLSKKFTTRVLTETQEFLRQSSLHNQTNHSQIYSYLGMKSLQSSQQKSLHLFRPKQSKIRQKKKQSLIEVQAKLLKKVKLSFLKEDLTKKFQQIRTQQQRNSALCQ